MTLEEFSRLADDFGGDLSIWPAAEADRARALLAGEQAPQAGAILEAAQALDAELDLALDAINPDVAVPSDALMSRIPEDAAEISAERSASGAQSIPRQVAPQGQDGILARLLGWFENLSTGRAATGVMAAGLALGIALPEVSALAGTGAETLFGGPVVETTIWENTDAFDDLFGEDAG